MVGSLHLPYILRVCDVSFSPITRKTRAHWGMRKGTSGQTRINSVGYGLELQVPRRTTTAAQTVHITLDSDCAKRRHL